MPGLKSFAFATLLSVAASYAVAEQITQNTSPPVDNPIVLQRADPMLVRHDDTGCYTFIGTSPKFDEIELRQACRLNDLKLAEPKVIWRKHERGEMSVNIWAPELHKVDDAWYIYFAAGDIDKPFSIRMYALKNTSADPMQGEWQEAGRIESGWDTFALDGTTFTHNGKRYYVWAQQNKARTYNSALWIAEMTSPTTLKLPATLLSEPTLDWEVQGYKVNEGAAVISHGEHLFITYSASATDHRYAMGLLWANNDADLLDPESWQKKSEPVFTTNAKAGRYGPGHNSFVKGEDGETDLMIYHSRDYEALKGTPLTDPNRHARARVLTWDEKGFPVFAEAASD
ncbi:glycoside hydrolase family 43 protein [Alteromonas sp. RKMC-009]|uniref:glycoside hydrolase family 43 protein n=1 Tax=Alteromonas sp. RKMC-009 TaxID=2267264 RepID=UPI000E691851|nr:family 43 glycosylhydrolase [Alteromonas sp. RKMC-009]AYA66180.1 alpha-N-arabinofuranosidase [Alteromonas sp. RKMC-009]MEC7691369.1 family 43 glycosylhydrolase [Pseudomonadota bacterium]